MTVAVLVPYRPNTADREANWAWLRPQWEALGYEVITDPGGDGPWRKGLAIHQAAQRTDAKVVVVADADIWCNGVEEAVFALQARGPGGWAVPHGQVLRFDQETTQRVLRGEPGPIGYDRNPYTGVPGGGLVILHRETLLEVPIDPRFENWGQEDESWAYALRCLCGGAWRGDSPLYHLWHEPEPRIDKKIGSIPSKILWRRYRVAQSRPELMRQILDEAKEAIRGDHEVRAEPRRHPSATHRP